MHAFQKNGEWFLSRGAVSDIAKKFELSARQIYRFWGRLKRYQAETGYWNMPFGKQNNGRERLYNREEIMDALEDVPHEHRGTYRDMAGSLGVALRTAHRLVKKDEDAVVVPHTAEVKPTLTPEQQLARIHYAASRVVETEDGRMFFDLADDEVHVDEKWFDIDNRTQRVYLTTREIEQGKQPEKQTRHKNHMIKAMFLCANARPRFDANGNCTFDGKIGIWPLVEQVAAQRTSVNRRAGTMETKCISLTKDVYRDFMVGKVLPAIVDKWPRNHAPLVKIRIQQDGPKTHNIFEDEQWIDAIESYNHFEFKLYNQPAQSPDTNTNDLGFFASLQAETWKMKRSSNIDGLIANVEKAFQEYDPVVLNRIYLTHMTVCNAILENDGNNRFDIPHMQKQMLERTGNLPSRVELSEAAKERFELLELRD